MLCLTRSLGETIVIGENIRVTVTRIRGREVRLTIDAPRQVNIARAELLEVADTIEHEHDLGGEG
jgi:carbon storage regulator